MGIEDLIIRIHENITLDADCTTSHQDTTNEFTMAYSQNIEKIESGVNEIHFNGTHHTKTHLHPDLRHLCFQRYRIYHGKNEIPIITIAEYLRYKKNLDLFFASKGLNNDDFIVLITRYNYPDRRDTNALFKEEISGQIQSFEIYRVECF